MRTFILIALLATLLSIPAFAQQKKNDAIEKNCKKCHSTAIIYNKKYDSAKWDATIERMKKHGLVVSADDEKTVKDFLYSMKK